MGRRGAGGLLQEVGDLCPLAEVAVAGEVVDPQQVIGGDVGSQGVVLRNDGEDFGCRVTSHEIFDVVSSGDL